jgi:hypothetical protein
MRFSLEHKILQATINYLGTRPYNEVAGLIAEIQKDVKAIPENASKTDSTETANDQKPTKPA